MYFQPANPNMTTTTTIPMGISPRSGDFFAFVTAGAHRLPGVGTGS